MPQRRPRLEAAGLAARHEAVRLLGAVLRRGVPFDEALHASLESGGLARLEERDRALTRTIAATVLRRLGQIDAVLARFLERPLPAKAALAHETLRAGAAQILFMRVPAHAAVALSVDLARADRKSEHAAGLVNAVLRRVASEGPAIAEGQDAARLSTPAWLWQRWTRAYGDAAHDIAEQHLAEPPLDLSCLSDPSGWAEKLGGILVPTGTVRIEEPKGCIEELAGFSEGRWWVQDAAAALPARLFGDVRGRRVLDLCAAPGGKTATLAAAGADVTAVDHSPARLERLTTNLARLELSALAVLADARNFADGAPYDAVLLDAPCSATGTIRRHPDVVHLKSEADIAALVPLQRQMLSNAATLVRSGGTLLYSVCSLEPEEGEEQVERLLAATSRLRRLPIAADEIAGQAQFLTPAGDLRTLPHQRIGPSRGLDGFFAARLQML